MFPLLYVLEHPLLDGPLSVVVVFEEGVWEMFVAGRPDVFETSEDAPVHFRGAFDDPDVGVSMIPFNRGSASSGSEVEVVRSASAEAIDDAVKRCAAVSKDEIKKALRIPSR